MKHALIGIQIHDIDRNKWKRFQNQMKEQGWSTVTNVANTFRKSYEDEESVRSIVKQEIRSIVKTIDCSDWDVVCTVSNQEPVAFKQ